MKGIHDETGEILAAATPAQATSFPRERQFELIRFVAKAGLADLDSIVNRFFRKEHETLLDAKPRAMAALQRLMVQEYLQARPVVLDAVHVVEKRDLETLGKFYKQHLFIVAVQVTPRASRDFSQPLPPSLRENFVQHSIKTVRAIVDLESAYRAQGTRVLDWKSEAELIRENFTGKIFDGNQNIIPAFPDAQLTVEHSDGHTETINVEYVTSKYTDAMISAKQSSFVGNTVWVADRSATAARIERITGSPARIAP